MKEGSNQAGTRHRMSKALTLVLLTSNRKKSRGTGPDYKSAWRAVLDDRQNPYPFFRY